MENSNGHGIDNMGDYFTSYEDLEVHEIMLTDKRRNLAYKDAIENNKQDIEDKIVLDVGAGTGFLSVLCARAGARKVFAVEASEGMIPLLRETCRANGLEGVIEVVAGEIESVELPEKVDIIVSEWMGFYLIHEGMLSSVIYARDKFLKPDGIMIPDKSRIKACLCKIPSLFDFWEDVDGVNLSHVGVELRKKYQNEPAVLALNESNIISSEITIAEFDLQTVVDSDLAVIAKEMVAVPTVNGVAQGICLSFEVSMFGEVFSTSARYPPTHWKQSVVVFPGQVEVEVGEGMAYKITLTRTTNPRRYAIELAPLEVDEVEHDVGCECSMARCRIINAYIKEQERLEDSDVLDDMECNGHD